MTSKFLGHGANDLFWFILPLVLPTLLIQYDLSYSQAGAILTLYLGVTAVGSLILGKLSDRYSQRKILAYGLILSSCGLCVSGFAPSLPIFLLLIAVTGVGVSSFHPTMYAVLDEHFPEKKGRVLSLYETSGTTAILLMFLINGYLLQKIGVQGVLIVTAVPAFIMGIHYLTSSAIPVSARMPDVDGSLRSSATARDIVRYVLFLTSVIMRVLSIAAVVNFLPIILVNFLNFDRSVASYATAFYFAGATVGSLTAGTLSVRYNPLAVLVSGIFLIIPFSLALTVSLPGWAVLMVISFLGFFGSGCLIPQNLLMTSFGRHLGKGEVFGIMMASLTIAGAVSPIIFGVTIDHWGLDRAIFLFSLPLLAAVGCLAYLLKTEDHERTVPA